jgi:uncharacterized protein (DUF1330 family)
MKYYLIAELEITDQSWVADYIKNVTGLVERHGGRYLARTPKVERIEGQRKPAGIFVIVEWPSKESALAFMRVKSTGHIAKSASLAPEMSFSRSGRGYR